MRQALTVLYCTAFVHLSEYELYSFLVFFMQCTVPCLLYKKSTTGLPSCLSFPFTVCLPYKGLSTTDRSFCLPLFVFRLLLPCKKSTTGLSSCLSFQFLPALLSLLQMVLRCTYLFSLCLPYEKSTTGLSSFLAFSVFACHTKSLLRTSPPVFISFILCLPYKKSSTDQFSCLHIFHFMPVI